MSEILPHPTESLAPEESFTDAIGKPLTEGSHLFCQHWPSGGGPGVYGCFLWEVVRRGPAGRLALAGEGQKKWLQLTQERAAKLVVYEPAEGLTLGNCREQWSWWRSYGWGLVLRRAWVLDNTAEMGLAMGVEILAYNGPKRRSMNFAAASWGVLQQAPGALERLVGEALYFVLHPRKARALCVLGEDPIPDEVYLPFVAKMRQRAKKMRLA